VARSAAHVGCDVSRARSEQGRLRAGVIGLGIGARHADALYGRDDVDLVVVCDLDRLRLNEIGKQLPGVELTRSWEEVVAAPDLGLIVIATYDSDHATQVLAALGHGKHVFVEKPLCTTESQLREIRSALSSRPELFISSNLVLRREPRFLELRNRIREGRLGVPFLLEGSYDYGRMRKLTDGWRGREVGYSVMHGGGIHLIDLLTWLKQDSSVEEVVAHGSGLASAGTTYGGRDLVHALLRFSDGALGRVMANFACVTPHHHRVSVYGTLGTFEQSHHGVGYLWRRDDPGSGRPSTGPSNDREPDRCPYPIASKSALTDAFVDLLQGRPSECPSGQEVLEVMCVSLAVEASLVRGGPVLVEEFRQ
jgi:predicted dehydrogenase